MTTTARGMSVEGLARVLEAGSARGPDAGFVLQLVEARAPCLGFARDVAIADAVAEANDHALTLVRIIPICKREFITRRDPVAPRRGATTKP
jgi:hypothetical protein